MKFFLRLMKNLKSINILKVNRKFIILSSCFVGSSLVFYYSFKNLYLDSSNMQSVIRSMILRGCEIPAMQERLTMAKIEQIQQVFHLAINSNYTFQPYHLTFTFICFDVESCNFINNYIYIANV